MKVIIAVCRAVTSLTVLDLVFFGHIKGSITENDKIQTIYQQDFRRNGICYKYTIP